MKFQVLSSTRHDSLLNKGFTLPEILIAMTIFIFVVAGIISANIFGLRLFKINETKLSATEWSRNTFGKLSDEIHSCSSVYVGNVSTNGFFETLLDGEPQQGNGLLIYPTSDTNRFITYFLNRSDQTFRRITTPPEITLTNNTLILADSVTNTLVFRAQDLLGNVMTNKQNNRVIHLTLEFYQPERFTLGPDYYKLETSVTRRALD